MPLRGKILNTWEVDSAEVLSSKEVHDISVALGVDPGSDNLEQLRYGKVCILADADSDGLHIATFCRSRNQDIFGTGLEMTARLFFGAEPAGAFQN